MEKHEGEWAAGPEGHSWVRVASAVPPGARPGCGKTGTAGEGGTGKAPEEKGRRAGPCTPIPA